MDFVLTLSLIRIVFRSIKQMEKYDVIFETTQNNSERKASPKIIPLLASKLCVHPGFRQLLGPIHSLRKIIRGNIFLNSHHLHIMVKS